VRIPNADAAIIEETKARDYLLNADHRENRGKARVLAALGYEAANWTQFAQDLRRQHLTQEITRTEDTPFGPKWMINASLRGPRGSAMMISVWMTDLGETRPRLVTLRPV
jgi:hypothetical protein